MGVTSASYIAVLQQWNWRLQKQIQGFIYQLLWHLPFLLTLLLACLCTCIS